MPEMKTMSRPKKPPRRLTTIKIDLDIAEMARAIVGHKGGELIDLYSDILRPIIRERFERAVREAAKKLDKGD